MPIASPATVSVTQDDGLPMKGSAKSAKAGTRASGSQSVFVRGNSVTEEVSVAMSVIDKHPS
jgi:hypothetical protein